jgi:antitoxin component YwqK of YwqJK toxin-antitoxin module
MLFPDGKQKAKGAMKAGKQSGPWSFWNPDGSPQLQLSGTYEAGVRVADSTGAPVAPTAGGQQ